MIIPLAEIKEFLRIDPDYTGNDSTLTSLCNAVQEQIEGWLNIGLENKTREYIWDGYGCQLPYGPVTEIVSSDPETEINVVGDYITCNSLDGLGKWWYMDNGVPSFGTSRWGQTQSIKVAYKSGYTEMPALVKTAMLNYIDHLFRSKGTISEPIPDHIKYALKRYNRNYII